MVESAQKHTEIDDATEKKRMEVQNKLEEKRKLLLNHNQN